jgi:uncharacterized protein with PhoU and TrkA domain
MTPIQHSAPSFKDGHFGLVWVSRGLPAHWLIVGWSDAQLIEGDVLVASGTYAAVQAARRLMGDSL